MKVGEFNTSVAEDLVLTAEDQKLRSDVAKGKTNEK
ncbi:hypothetical protein QO002_005597 [Pararhizobium capsulatum DSM 1112]|uniref:Uncharacterized protein n=1 Tax=Pararhizobium capsulatum DSM 1112 TaxID=1121113 RepID=A0ABU0C0G2_9HYPH|nr:hypothetical protein [Pararhizobium capsulatum DSM 1112]